MHQGGFNTLFKALFARYNTRQLCCFCSAARLLSIALQITSAGSADTEKVSDACNVEGDAAVERSREEGNEEEEKEEEEEEDKEEKNTDHQDDPSCSERRIDSHVVKCDFACEEAFLLGSLRKQRKADWVEQGGGLQFVT